MPRSPIHPTPADTTPLSKPRLETRPVPPYSEPFFRPPPRPPDKTIVKDSWKNLQNFDPDRKVEFEENSPHQEGIISETYERPDASLIQDPPESQDLIDTSKLIQRFLPKLVDIDKILDIIKRKVLKGTHLLLTIIEIQAGYLTSPYFKDLYLYLAQNKLPNKKGAICKVENLAERFILLDSLLFNLTTTPEKETALLAVLDMCMDKIITLYHTSLFTGHQGVVKTYLTINDNFFIPGLAHYLGSYIKGCHTCQIVKTDKQPTRQLQPRIYLNYRPLCRLSMDLKVMPGSQKGYKFILCIIDEVTNYLITVPIFQAKSEEIGEALIENVITKYCIPDCIIMDQDSVFMSSLKNFLFKKFEIKVKMVVPYNHQSLQVEYGIKSLSNILKKHQTEKGQMWLNYLPFATFAYNTFNSPNLEIKVKTVAPYNHQSLQVEYGIKSLSNILKKHQTEKGQMWLNYLPFATFAYNTFNSPNLANYSPYELVFGRKPKLLINVETDPDIKVGEPSKNIIHYLEKGSNICIRYCKMQEPRDWLL